MTTYLTDDFNRANGAIGSPVSGGPYTTVAGTWAIASNRLSIATGPGQITAPAAADVDYQWTITTLGSSSSARFGPTIRASGASYLGFHWTGGGGPNPLQLSYSGSVGPTLAATVALNDVFRIIAVGRLIYVFRNGLLVNEVETSYNLTNTAVGYAAVNTPSATLDDVTVQSPPTDPALGFASPHAGSIYRGRDTQLLDVAAGA